MTTTERIDAILKSRGMSRRQVAIAAKIPPSTLQSAMERGKNISVDMLQRIASALNVPVSELLGTVDEIDARITQKLQDAKKSLEEGKTSESEWEKIDLADAALFALRPVSREQVEKVWRGEWNNINPAVLKPGVSWVCRCAKCGCPQDYKHNFCPNCGAAQTDEAMQMVMERWKEAVSNEA